MRLIQNNDEQSTEFHIDVVACLFIPPYYIIGLDNCHNKLTLQEPVDQHLSTTAMLSLGQSSEFRNFKITRHK